MRYHVQHSNKSGISVHPFIILCLKDFNDELVKCVNYKTKKRLRSDQTRAFVHITNIFVCIKLINF